MDMTQHAMRTKELLGLEAWEIHKWIDGYFDTESFQFFLEGRNPKDDYDPYSHRRHRHCLEALPEAINEFSGRFSEKEIRQVFETHLKDDYNNYLPHRADFDDPEFIKKYHSRPSEISPRTKSSEDRLARYFESKYRVYPANRKKGNTGFSWRILLPVLLSMVLFISFIFLIIIPSIHEVMMDNKKEMIRELAQTGASIIQYYISREQEGSLTRNEAQLTAISELEKIRFGVQMKDYFWITDYHPRMIMHPYRPELIGTDLTEYRDSEDKSGIFLFAEAVELVKAEGQGFLIYQWQWMDDEDTSVPKLSYFTGISEWNWILGTGVYINDIEHEIETIYSRLTIISAILSFVLILILSWILLQSRKIERKRQKAESSLEEARNRYRSLVESSQEGYILIIGGKIVYANRTLYRMLDYPEGSLAELDIVSLLDKEENNSGIGELLRELASGGRRSGETEAGFLSGSGHSILCRVSVSPVFLSDENGLLFSLKSLSGFKQENLEQNEDNQAASLAELKQRIGDSHTRGHAILSLKDMSRLLRSGETGMGEIGDIYQIFLKRIIELSLEKRPVPPADFIFLSLGSNARGEMTFYSDQDNALIYSGSQENKTAREYFLNLGQDICSTLNQAGFSYCPGGIMAGNPEWNLSTDEFYKLINQLITQNDQGKLLQVSVLGDFKVSYGDLKKGETLQAQFLKTAAGSQDFMKRYAAQTLTHRVKLGFFGGISPEISEGEEILEIKESLKALEAGLRLFAVENQYPHPESLKRLKFFKEKEILPVSLCDELEVAFRTLWNARLKNQLKVHRELGKMPDEIPVKALSISQKEELTRSLKSIKDLQELAAQHFLGQWNL